MLPVDRSRKRTAFGCAGGLALVALLGVTASAIDTASGTIRADRLVVGWVCTVLTALMIVVAAQRGCPSARPWTAWLAAACFTLCSPLTIESGAAPNRADIAACLLMVSVVTVPLPDRSSRIFAMIAGGLAAALEPVALTWPVAILLAARCNPRMRLEALAFLAIATTAAAISAWYGWIPRPHNTAPVHRDILVQLPMLVIGAAGYRPRSGFACQSAGLLTVSRWMSLSCVCVAVAVAFAGAPLDVRMTSLPFYVMLPSGVGHLSELIRSAAAPARRLGYLAAILTFVLALPLIERIRDASLLTFFALGL